MPPHPLDLLAVYRDLTADERRQVEAHLAGCAECRATLAAYQQQDAALHAIPRLLPKRAAARPFDARALRPRGHGLTTLSGAFALAGLAALVGFLILRVQAPAVVAAEPGLTLPPTVVRLPSPWLPALPWLSASLLLVGLLLVFSRRSAWPPVAASMLCVLLLGTFVPPLSAVPNPAAIYWRLAGGYNYDPRLPFKNAFLIPGRPEQQLKDHLEGLIGQVGLSPLDPNQPLVSYQFLRVGLHPEHNRVALVTTRFIYADGSSHVYPVPLVDPVLDWNGFLLGGWREDGLERLRSEHLALAGQPFATVDSPIRLGPARRLDLQRAARRLDEATPTHWLWQSVRLQRLVWSPDGQAFLCAIELDTARRQMWWVSLDGSAPQPIGEPGDIREYGFSPDGRTIIYTHVDTDALSADASRPFAIIATEIGARAAPRTLATLQAEDRLPGLTADGAWFFASDDRLWIAPFDGSSPRPAGAADLTGQSFARPSHDGSTVAYGCGPNLCLTDLRTGSMIRVDGLRPADVTWSRDDSRLAVITRDLNDLRPVGLHVLDRQGALLVERDIAPRDVTDPPQWTPDGGAIFVQTFPQDGRRIIALDIASGQVLDLSQARWDAYFALSPDGQTLLLNNGRGDFWLADVIR